MKALRKTYHFILFLVFYQAKLVMANIYIAYDILTPRMRTNPGIIEVNVPSLSDIGILLLSNLVSMTPGTLSMDLNPDKDKLQVHVLYMNRRAATEKEIAQIIKRIKQITE